MVLTCWPALSLINGAMKVTECDAIKSQLRLISLPSYRTHDAFIFLLGTFSTGVEDA